MVVLEEDVYTRGAIPLGAVEWHFDHFVATGEGEGLRWWKIGGGGEVEGVAVTVEVDRLRRRGGVGGAEEEGEEFHGAGESEALFSTNQRFGMEERESRNVHYHLLIIVIACELRTWVVALSPRFLDNTSAGFWCGFVERRYVVKLNFGVERRLQGWLEVVRMVMIVVAMRV